MIINSQAFNARGADARRINIKTAYAVDFETEELVQKAIHKLDAHLHVSKIFYKVQTGVMNQIKSKETLTKGEAFKEKDSRMVEVDMSFNNTVKYDLIGNSHNYLLDYDWQMKERKQERNIPQSVVDVQGANTCL